MYYIFSKRGIKTIMLHRKIEKNIVNYLQNGSNKIMIINGAKQIGKSYIIRYVGSKLLKDKFKNYMC